MKIAVDLLSGEVIFFISLAALITVSTLSWYLIEQPVNRMKRFFVYTGKEQR